MDLHSTSAPFTFAAENKGQACHPLAHPEAADAGANLTNFATKFMAHYRTRRHAHTVLASVQV
jgi:hypothetical protein